MNENLAKINENQENFADVIKFDELQEEKQNLLASQKKLSIFNN